MHSLISKAALAASLLLAAAAAFAAEPGLYQPNSGSSARIVRPPRVAATPVIENGRQCTVIDFEGVGDLAPIPVFDGISSPGWLGLIDADAGGSGNFAQEPSPQTIAFWLGGDPGSRDIVMTNPVSKLEFYYASFVSVTMQALDEAGNVLATSTGGPNFNGGSGDPNGQFNKWDPLSVEADGNKIKTVRVTGNTNQTGIDNLKVCATIGVKAAELTQAIQQYQELKDFKASLAAGREPPVPMVADKQGVLRLYMDKVTAVTDVKVRVSGAISQTRSVSLQPQCSADDQRRLKGGCKSIDFYFKPPSGNWDLKVEVLDAKGTVLETHDFPLKSRKTDALTLKAISVCDAKNAAGAWQCAPASALASKVSLLRKLTPSASVSVNTTNSSVKRETSGYPNVVNWWVAAAKDANDMFGFFDWLAGVAGDHRTYYGMVRSNVPGGIGGIAHDIPSHAALGRVSATRLGVETVQEVVAHEVGHTLGLRHTNTQVPAAGGAPPGCYNLAVDPGTDWPFANNRIQSAARLEVAFDVAAQKPLLPESTFEIISYCVPRWISPFSYKKQLANLGGGAVTSPSVGREIVADMPLPRRVGVPGQYWSVSGVLENGMAVFDPLFDDARAGPVDQGVGSHKMEVQDAAGAVLFTRYFTPSAAQTESDGDEGSGPPVFFELLPIQAGAARIALSDAAGAGIGTLAFGGAAPAVTLLQPGGPGPLSGQQEVRWQVSDSDSALFSSKVYYSANGGADWAQLGKVDGGGAAGVLTADFDALPGSYGMGQLRVVVSDGINTGSATSAAFSVPKKTPGDLLIVSPQPGAVFAAQSLVQFEGSAFDGDDGVLGDAAISWHSSLDGPLGTGVVLGTTTLRPGLHQVTMTATDSDGNAATASTTLRVAGQAPSMALAVQALDTLPTTCMEATIVPRAETGGAALALSEYSLDGGAAWTGIALNKLPHKFIVPGSGYFHLIARAFDEAGQVAVRDAKFFIDTACAVSGPPRLDGAVAGRGLQAPGVLYVDVVLRNGGQGMARAARLATVTPRTLAGSGAVSYNTALSPPLPAALPDLAPGESATLRLYFNVPAGVTRFSLAQGGSLQDIFGRSYTFAASQSVIP